MRGLQVADQCSPHLAARSSAREDGRRVVGDDGRPAGHLELLATAGGNGHRAAEQRASGDGAQGDDHAAFSA